MGTFATAAKKRGIKIYHLNIGQPDIKAPEAAIDAVRHYHEKLIEYAPSPGIQSYREKLAEYYKTKNIMVEADDIIITTGGSEALSFAFLTCFDKDDELLIPEPFYANYKAFATVADVKFKTVPSYVEDGFALPPIEEFEKIITPRTKAIVVCNPNNPTGYLYTRAELEKVAELCKKHDIFLIADEVYREFVYDGQEHYSVMNLKGVEQNVILLDSVSKRYSACGVRIGAFISKNKEVMASAMKQAQGRLSSPTFGQVFSEAAINTPQSYFDEVVDEYVARRNLVVSRLNKMKGCFCPNPMGAFYTVARLPIDDSDIFCQWLLEEFQYNGETVMFAPATGFYDTPGRGKDEVRISYCLCVEDLAKAMDILEKALEVYPGRKK